MAKYPWNECMADQIERYGSETTARKVCGSIRAKSMARKRSKNMSGSGCGCGGQCGCGAPDQYVPQHEGMSGTRHLGRMSSTMGSSGGNATGIAALLFPVAVIGGILLVVNSGDR